MPIPGTTKISHLDDNMRARGVQLDAAELKLVAAAVPQDAVKGFRFQGGDATTGTYKSNL